MSLEVKLILLALAVLLAVYLFMYFVAKQSSPILKLIWQNEHYQVYESLKGATVAMMYESLHLDFDKLLMADSAREDFCKKHADQLSVDRCNFFLSKRFVLLEAVPSNLFVIIIGFKTAGSYFTSTDKYLHPGFWSKGIRLVIPKQKA